WVRGAGVLVCPALAPDEAARHGARHPRRPTDVSIHRRHLARSGGPGLPEAFARYTAIGDMVITVLAWLALIALRAGWRFAIPAVWLFNLVGLGDLLLNLGHGVRLQVASQLGAAWFGPAFIVPGMLVIHVLVFVFLVRSKAGAV